MKRKRGSKKSKAKKRKVMASNENAEDVNTVNNSVAGEEIESDGSGSGGDDEAPSSVGTDQALKPAAASENQPEKPATSSADQAQKTATASVEQPQKPATASADQPQKSATASVDQPQKPAIAIAEQPKKPATASASSGGFSDSTVIKAVYGRVKVRIKTSKILESQATTSEAPTKNEPEKSSQPMAIEKQEVPSEKKEDSPNSLSEANNVSVSADVPKKSAGIKIKSKNFSSNISPCSNAETSKGENQKTQTKEPSSVFKDSVSKDSRYNKKELDDSLEVIKKVMKMEAAEPFNTPVDPVALGIPDYFDVIDTPMDFGTIRSNLESGVKYMNSEDVFNDVRYIWDNCYKYNNKGDLVLELMKRVKKNFSKYWSAAGLFSEHAQGVESSQTKDGTPDSNGKESSKGGPSSNKSRKLHGLKKHKDGCLCAICVMMRRRQEREESTRALEEQMETSSDYRDEGKPEETTPAESLGGEYASSNMENSPEMDIDSNMQEKPGVDLYNRLHDSQEEKQDSETEIPSRKEGKISALMQLGSRSAEDHSKHQNPNMESGNENHAEKGTSQSAISEHQKQKEKLDKLQKAKMLKNLSYLENPRVFELCSTLFADDKRSVWNGPHSLIQQKASNRKSNIRAAVSTLLK